MQRRSRTLKWILMLAPLVAPPIGGSLDTSINHCEQFPYPVVCWANSNHPGQHYAACYNTLCEAAAAGAYQCRRKFKGTTCEIQP